MLAAIDEESFALEQLEESETEPNWLDAYIAYRDDTLEEDFDEEVF